jgi:ribonucleoside-diphosphate reductase beta chain
MTIFNHEKVDHLLEPMFFGSELNVSRTETVKHKSIAELTEKQLGFFWRPAEIVLTQDIADFANLKKHEKHLFLANLKYQTLLDSIQGRAPSIAFLPVCSDPALERWIETWSFSETIHSESYTHIVRTVMPSDMSKVFDEIVTTPEIMRRATSIGIYYDNLIEFNAMRALNSPEYNEYEHKKALYLCMHAVNALEAIRFYVSFAVTFSFGERKLMSGNCNIMALIARDEALHLKGTQFILNTWHRGLDKLEWKQIAEECRDEATLIFLRAAAQEKEWAEYLTSLGSVIGLNKNILCKYVDYLTDQRMRAVGLDSPYEPGMKNPIPWINNWLNSSNKQTAPQEAEIINYVTGGLSTETFNSDSLLEHLKG